MVNSATAAPKSQPTELIIEPGRTELNYWSDLWHYRELFLILAWRDISVRYKQTIIGVAWALIRPVLTTLVFTIIFGRIANLPSEGEAPYALMVFAGSLPWTLFSTSLVEASNSLLGNERLISKVYFPRLIIPSATMVTSLVDFLISLVVLAGLMLFFSFSAHLEHPISPSLHALGPAYESRARAVDYGFECKISGFSLYYPFHCPVWPLYFAGRL